MPNRLVQIALTGLILSVSFAEASDFSKLISKIPGGANSLVMMDTDAILASPVAMNNGWAKKFSEGSADRPMYLPPEADKVVIGSQLDLVRGCARSWEVAVMGMKEPVPMRLIARAEGGYVDEIRGVKVAWVPSDAYFIEIDTETLGLMAPANRQAIARWSDHEKTPQVGLSEYLKSAATQVDKGTQAVLAIDATDAIQTHRVKAKLEGSEFVKGADLDKTVALVSSLRGLVLKLSFTDKVRAVAQLDFATSVTLPSNVAKTLVLGALEDLELTLPGTENWTCSVSTNSITLSGELENDALRRIFTLMEVPTTKFSSLKDADFEDNSQATMAKSSVAYFHSVDALLKDLKTRTKSNSGGDAGWTDRYATKIDRLPILNVDQELLNWGEKVSETLRVMAGSRRMSNMQGASAERVANSQTGLSYTNDGYGYGGYNYTSPRAAAANVSNVRADAVASGTSVKLQGWTLIDNSIIEIRKSMTMRYGVEF
jgi:hypothetical protein